MKKDIDFPQVSGVHMAIVKERYEQAEEWAVYIINENEVDLENVFITSKGYGESDGKQIKTTALRRFIGTVKANEALRFELIPEELLSINNEFWLSYYIERTIYDKKYIFVAESLIDDHVTNVPVLNKQGVLIT